MLRKDGIYNIFQIEVLYKDGKSWHDGTGMPEGSIGEKSEGAIVIKGLKHNGQTGGYLGTCAKEYREFTACGDCWQETGVHGTYNMNSAIHLMHAAAECNPGRTFRIISLTLTQVTNAISTMCIPKKEGLKKNVPTKQRNR